MDRSLIEKLNKYKNSNYPILSVYVSDSSKVSPPAKILLSKVRSLIHQNLSKEEKKIFKEDLERIFRYLTSEYDKRKKHTLIFFSAGKKLWQVSSLDHYLPSLCLVSYSPYLTPIEESLTGDFNHDNIKERFIH